MYNDIQCTSYHIPPNTGLPPGNLSCLFKNIAELLGHSCVKKNCWNQKYYVEEDNSDCLVKVTAERCMGPCTEFQ